LYFNYFCTYVDITVQIARAVGLMNTSTPSSLPSLGYNPDWFTVLVSAYPDCLGKDAVKRVSVCLSVDD